MYFVARNHINYFGSAIVRSHRFDALILVSPPSFKTKIDRLKDLLHDVHDLSNIRFQIKEQQVQNDLENFRDDPNRNAADEMQRTLQHQSVDAIRAANFLYDVDFASKISL